MSILNFLGLEKKLQVSAASPDSDTIRKIAKSLDELDPDRARYIAAFAYILSRVAHADLKISEDETRVMEGIVMEHAGLPEEQTVMIVQMAKHQNLLFGGTENFLVTREFNKIASREQKMSMLDCLFAVAAAEHLISVTEDNEIRLISDQLRLDHRDFIEVRTRYRDHLAVLKQTSTPASDTK